ncbi:MAG TPA: Crp/Fnr family transcriptional regulator [Pseudolabrys sp.]|nr:Crp/Fnr family transcriptional regulator [Pseudolabrys sp.]
MLLDQHPFIARLSQLIALSSADLRHLEHILDGERSVKKRKDLVIEGHEYRNLCFIKDGFAIRYKLLRSGKRQILNVVLPGDIVGLPVSFFERSNYSVVALSDITFNVCSVENYVQLCLERPQFGLALGWLAVQEAATYAEHIVDIGRRTPLERAAHFLLEMHARLLTIGRARELSYEMPVSQEVMADVLGLSVPHLNRVLQQLRADKLITTRGRLTELTELEALQSLAQYQPLQVVPLRLPTEETATARHSA